MSKKDEIPDDDVGDLIVKVCQKTLQSCLDKITDQTTLDDLQKISRITGECWTVLFAGTEIVINRNPDDSFDEDDDEKPPWEK